MRVLLAGEESGVGRREWRKRGHDAWSCDLVPARDGSRFHYQEDARNVVRRYEWDILIHHMPCTCLTNAGARWLYVGGKGSTVKDEQRWALMREGAELFRDMQNSDVPHVCGENPVPHGHALELIGPYTQIIQPYEHGHGETKKTCLWLKDLPPLVPSNPVPGREQRIWKMAPSATRQRDRSESYPGILGAMADQWGIL
jgi:hypothetical protein